MVVNINQTMIFYTHEFWTNDYMKGKNVIMIFILLHAKIYPDWLINSILYKEKLLNVNKEMLIKVNKRHSF